MTRCLPIAIFFRIILLQNVRLRFQKNVDNLIKSKKRGEI